jgi:tetratricopeptide (TPR) repeat protein
MKRKKLSHSAKSQRASPILQAQSESQAIVISDQTRGTRGRHVLPALIVLITFSTFLPVLRNGFVDLDNRTLTENFNYRGLGWAELQWMFGDFQFGQYQPLTWLTLALDYSIWWSDPFGYHWTNLVLHISNSVLFYYIGLRLIIASPSESLSDQTTWRMSAGFATVIAALHPLRVEAVAWASARAEVLAALLFLSSIYCYLRARGSAETSRFSTRWMLLSVLAYACSLLAGPGGVMLPVVLLALDNYPLQRLARLSSGSLPEARRVYLEKAPYLLVAIAFYVTALAARNHPSAARGAGENDLFNWLLDQLAAPGFFLWKAILPIGLAPAYEPSTYFLGLATLTGAVISVALITWRRRWPSVSTAWVCYLALLLSVFRAHFSVPQTLADRHTYLAVLPLALLVSLAAVACWKGCSKIHLGQRAAFVAGGLATILVLSLGVLTWEQSRMWQDADSLWKNAVAASPTNRAYFNLASLSEAQGKYEDAIALYQKAAALDPEGWKSHEKAASLLQQRGKIAEAIEHYRIVVQLNPNAVDARDNLAAGLVNQGKIGEAVQHFRKLLELAPERNETRLKLGIILAVEGRIVEAAQILMQAAAIDPNDGKVLLRLGQVLAAQRKFSEAVRYFRQAVRLRNDDAEVHESLGKALLEVGQKEEASRHLQDAVRILRSSPAPR